MRQQIAAVAALTGACVLLAACTNIVEGKAAPGPKAGLANQAEIPVGSLDNVLLDTSQINTVLGATSMKVWFSAKVMWDWSKNVTDIGCLAIDGAAQEKVYSGTGWTSIRGQRLDDSPDNSTNRSNLAIQAVVAFPKATDANNFYNNSVQSWKSCSNRQYSDVNNSGHETVWSVSGANNDNGMLSSAQVEQAGGGWGCQRALTVRSNVAIDIMTCKNNANGNPAVDIANQIAGRIAKLQ
ncbi:MULTISPECIES: sensor domain-containing protein [Mycobacterium]|uniref:Sensor domain-containing protein n=1 Tax=Mycobacterium kiyosense TaxID=2871094 RepID=A0A9P3Q7L4_9MYCO|nr:MULTISPECIES: sensor domain-containing protein [Mycobacterium]GLB97767.1 sensor domain-containing protein [Mycobacterium kiyosense]GLC02915.1 sensor domain-containing protein [Mycobacterium kiyosense]GLD19045.1 sensor domain-containing protein [Mycobacterium kiyosense]GLD31339.1 sensor domain-containing protein [Mycobacterium kiyosense]